MDCSVRYRARRHASLRSACREEWIVVCAIARDGIALHSSPSWLLISIRPSSNRASRGAAAAFGGDPQGNDCCHRYRDERIPLRDRSPALNPYCRGPVSPLRARTSCSRSTGPPRSLNRDHRDSPSSRSSNRASRVARSVRDRSRLIDEKSAPKSERSFRLPETGLEPARRLRSKGF